MPRLPPPTSHLLAALLLTGCYRYTPLSEVSPTSGSHVRMALTQPPDSGLTRILGTQVVAVEGRVLSLAEAAYGLSVTATFRRAYASAPLIRTNWVGEPVTIPRSAVGAVELRSLDRKRTNRALVLGTVLAVVGLRVIVFAIGGSGGGDDGGGVITPP